MKMLYTVMVAQALTFGQSEFQIRRSLCVKQGLTKKEAASAFQAGLTYIRKLFPLATFPQT